MAEMIRFFMKKLNRIILSVLLVMTLVITSTSSVFATEAVNTEVSSEATTFSSVATGTYRNSASVQFITKVDIQVSTSKIAPKATFSINGYADTSYKVEIISPIGTSYTTYIMGDGSSHSHQFATLVSGNYFFHVWPWTGTAGNYCTFNCSLN